MTPPGFDPERFLNRFAGDGHTGLLGLRYVAHGNDHVVLVLPYQPKLLAGNSLGMADGAIITLLDMAATLAVWTVMGEIRPHATIDLRLDHLVSPPAGADIVAHAECYHRRAQIASVRGTVRASTDETIATFVGSYMLMGG
jgi:uncharacterized protein (TIGR00369 family)